MIDTNDAGVGYSTAVHESEGVVHVYIHRNTNTVIFMKLEYKNYY